MGAKRRNCWVSKCIVFRCKNYYSENILKCTMLYCFHYFKENLKLTLISVAYMRGDAKGGSPPLDCLEVIFTSHLLAIANIIYSYFHGFHNLLVFIGYILSTFPKYNSDNDTIFHFCAKKCERKN